MLTIILAIIALACLPIAIPVASAILTLSIQLALAPFRLSIYILQSIWRNI